jgi:CRP/FNR family cyclic AMP-dependent transcriptional regulator
MSVGQATLADARIFAGLSGAELEQVRSAFREHTCPAGSAIVREGERGARVLAFFVITSGSVRIESGGSFICTCGPGAHIGEIGLLEDVPRTATVIAENDVVCLGMSAWDFRRLVESHASIAAKLTEIAATRRAQPGTAGEGEMTS